MNEIEQMFYDAFIAWGEEESSIASQVPIGIYIADFVIYGRSIIPAIIEIDGHEFHKTKEQRFADYKKERYFMSEGYAVVRYMGSEIFVDAAKCADEAMSLGTIFNEKCIESFYTGAKER